MKMSRKQQPLQEERSAAAAAEEGCSGKGPPAEGETQEGRTVVVGVRADSESRALLTWVLVNVAAAGDRVVAVHVVLASGAEAAAAVDFDAMLGVYEGFCNLKQINLKVKICKDSSVRKALVREASLFEASKVVVGVTKRRRAISSSLSVAKYCAKKLPAKCAVLAVNNGKIVYRRESHAHSGKVSAEVPSCGDDEMYCVVPFQVRQGKQDTLSLDNSKDGAGRDSTHDVDTQGSKPEDTTTSEQPKSNVDPADLSTVQVQIATDPSCEAEESMAEPKDETAELPGDGASVLYCVLPGRGCDSVASTSSSKDHDSVDLPAEGDGELYCVLPPRTGHSGRSMGDSKRSTVSRKDDMPEGDTNLYCQLPRNGRSVVESESMFSFAVYDVVWPPSELESLREKYSSVCKMFSYEELKVATANYSPDMLIGKGGTSQVYKARLLDGTLSAVKILKPSVDAIHEFVTEVEIVTTLQHENVVALRGFSFENFRLVLVYDYMPQGSLDKALHGLNDDKNFLSWEKRNKIAIDIARALEFLHLGVIQSVIHGDVKSSNILLSEDFGARLCDFGLAKQVSAATPHLTCTDITGTFGYLAPEYFSYGKVNEKIDVYAFGVVLLEIISGRRPITPGNAKGKESLVGWAKPLLSSGEIKELVDPLLWNDYDCDEMERMTLAASLCTRTSAQSRPEMTQVVQLLQGDDETIDWARSQVTACFDGSDEEVAPANPNMQSHLSLALLGVDDETLSHCSSTERTVDTSAEDGYWSRSSSFD
ncbi:hypothetical protein QOZ80_3AG0208960 [Eleusine coracana subsp. coracana]|nr:hypothetical protein QOZ80_3AG0208960 [Eleusine coracana subsp. coracana]